MNGVSSIGETTPLFAAAMESHNNIVKLLLNHGADINETTCYGNTPVWMASKRGHLETVQILLQHNCDVNKTESDEKLTPLAVASVNGTFT